MYKDKITKLIEREKIEIAPLAFMRGRTLSYSYVILDEAIKYYTYADENVFN